MSFCVRNSLCQPLATGYNSASGQSRNSYSSPIPMRRVDARCSVTADGELQLVEQSSSLAFFAISFCSIVSFSIYGHNFACSFLVSLYGRTLPIIFGAPLSISHCFYCRSSPTQWTWKEVWLERLLKDFGRGAKGG